VHRFEKHELKPESAHTHRYNLHYVTLHFYSQFQACASV